MHWEYHTNNATIFCLLSNYMLCHWKLSQTRPLTIDSSVNNNHYCPQQDAKSDILVQYGCPRIPATCHRHMVSPQNFISFSLVRVLLIPTVSQIHFVTSTQRASNLVISVYRTSDQNILACQFIKPMYIAWLYRLLNWNCNIFVSLTITAPRSNLASLVKSLLSSFTCGFRALSKSLYVISSISAWKKLPNKRGRESLIQQRNLTQDAGCGSIKYKLGFSLRAFN